MQQQCPVPWQCKVLVAETKAQFPRFPLYLLRRYGCQVLEASHGYEAIYQVRQHLDLDVLIVETKLRFLGGWEVAERARVMCPGVSVIVLTSEEEWSVYARNVLCLPATAGPEVILDAVRLLIEPVRSSGSQPKKMAAAAGSEISAHGRLKAEGLVDATTPRALWSSKKLSAAAIRPPA